MYLVLTTPSTFDLAVAIPFLMTESLEKALDYARELYKGKIRDPLDLELYAGKNLSLVSNVIIYEMIPERIYTPENGITSNLVFVAWQTHEGEWIENIQDTGLKHIALLKECKSYM